MINNEKYSDILAMAVKNPTEEEELYLELTDHGWLDEKALRLLITRRMKKSSVTKAMLTGCQTVKHGHFTLMAQKNDT
ncbi:hypothetical protein N6Y36_08870 [Morganella morganii]|nr:hypothetical protein N6Y36_08870 [Morganella morganii]